MAREFRDDGANVSLVECGQVGVTRRCRIAPPLPFVRSDDPLRESASNAAMIRLAEVLADLTADELIRQAREADRTRCG